MAPAPDRELIAFRIGEQEFCVDIMAVREIRGWTPATPLPQVALLREGRDQPARRGAADRRPGRAPGPAGRRADRPPRHHRRPDRRAHWSACWSTRSPTSSPSPTTSSSRRRTSPATGEDLRERPDRHRRPDDQPDRPRARAAGRRSRGRMSRCRPIAAGRRAAGRRRVRLHRPRISASIAEILHGHAGIALTEGKAALVYSRLAKRLRALGLRSFRDYCALVEGVDGRGRAAGDDGGADHQRHPLLPRAAPFRPPARQVLPRLAGARAGAAAACGIWSAACSNGQEPYSIAMTILAVLPEAADLDVKILATDIDPNMIAEGKAGRLSRRLPSRRFRRTCAGAGFSRRPAPAAGSAPTSRAPGHLQRAEPDRRLADEGQVRRRSSAATS